MREFLRRVDGGLARIRRMRLLFFGANVEGHLAVPIRIHLSKPARYSLLRLNGLRGALNRHLAVLDLNAAEGQTLLFHGEEHIGVLLPQVIQPFVGVQWHLQNENSSKSAGRVCKPRNQEESDELESQSWALVSAASAATTAAAPAAASTAPATFMATAPAATTARSAATAAAPLTAVAATLPHRPGFVDYESPAQKILIIARLHCAVRFAVIFDLDEAKAPGFSRKLVADDLN